MEITINVDGDRAVAANLRATAGAIRDEVQRVLEGLGAEIVTHIESEYTQREVMGKGFQTRTGMLAASLGYRVDAHARGTDLVVEATAPYAAIVETMRDGSYAYMEPAIVEMKDEIMNRLREIAP